jgi:hypothetical protein
MTRPTDDETFLRRWSRLKKEEQQKPAVAENKEAPAREGEPAPPLPQLDSLTPQSDFSLFMHPKVQDAVRRVALKKLFADPHFNVMDLNEAYSGDWTGGEPITQEMLAQLNQARTLLFSDEEKSAGAEPSRDAARQETTAEQPTQAEQETKAGNESQDDPGRKDA